MIQLPPEWYDNTRISDFRRGGPRYFLWRHERHWRQPEITSISALSFGTCWHSGQDALWPEACGRDYDPDPTGSDVERLAGIAFDGFMDKWHEMELPLDAASLEEAKARIPSTAAEMYRHYVSQRQPLFSRSRLEGVEIPFVVPVMTDGSDCGYVGVIDKVIYHEQVGRLIPVDHKTTSRYDSKRGIRYDYVNNIKMSGQPQGYAYALSLLRPEEEITSALMDCSLVHKIKKEGGSRHDVHELVYVDCELDKREAWLQDTQQYISAIRAYRERERQGLPSWPRSCDTCATFGTCPYQDLCIDTSPLEDIELPAGWEVREWNPIQLVEGGEV